MCSTAFNLTTYGSKIDWLLAIMVIAVGIGCGHWGFYAVLHVVDCTARGINRGGGVGVESNQNLRNLDVLLGYRKGFGSALVG